MVLKHAYLFNLAMQRVNSTISDVIPSLMRILHFWKINQITTTQSCQRLSSLLIDEFTKRFEYELNSDYYKVK